MIDSASLLALGTTLGALLANQAVCLKRRWLLDRAVYRGLQIFNGLVVIGLAWLPVAGAEARPMDRLAQVLLILLVVKRMAGTARARSLASRAREGDVELRYGDPGGAERGTEQ